MPETPSVFEIDSSTAREYAIRHLRIEPNRIEELAGGVSNTVLLIEAPGQRLVLKQSLPQLRVPEEWFCDRARILRESASLKLLAGVLPIGFVPQVVDEDPENFAYTMTAAPAVAETWKTALLRGETGRHLARQAGQILGSMIRGTTQAQGFDDIGIFEQLRLDPYYQFTAKQHPETEAFFESLIEDCRTRKISLVHGDFSPKNLLVADNRMMAIDWECVHYGNPAFDVAFLLNHLLLKSFRLPEHMSAFADLAQEFWAAVEQPSLESSAVRHWAGVLLARIDGKSPVEYIREPELRQTIRLFALDLIAHPAASISEVLQRRSQWH